MPFERQTIIIKNVGLKEFILGKDQTWRDLTSQRQTGVTYTNTTGKAIYITASIITNSSFKIATLYVDGITICSSAQSNFTDAGAAIRGQLSAIVKNGSTYQVSQGTVANWGELR